MNITNITFFNRWRNGDCFINKEYVRDIISRYPNGITFKYAHDNHPNIVSDLNCEHIPLSSIHPIGTFTPLAQVENTLYINTWVGCWIGKHLKEKDHANFYCLHDMWKEFYQALNLEMKGDYSYYHPSINFQKFDLTEANHYFLRSNPKEFILICNGVQQSEQSSMGDMRNIIFELATRFPEKDFLIAHKVDVDLPNVTCTDYLFSAPTGNLNQIAFLSMFAKLIIGKNSGPFTYAHIKENMNNYQKTFMCFSHKMRDCLMGEGEYLANSFFSDTVDDTKAIEICENLIQYPSYANYKKPTVELFE
jgi:hypothetical protein